MMIRRLLIPIYLLLISSNLKSQKTVDLSLHNFKAVNTIMDLEIREGEKVVRAVKDSAVKEFDEPTFVRINSINFSNGIIEVKVLSRLLADAPDFARGFIGIAFRINDTNSKFESIYLRPLNATVEDQTRRNRSIQYFSYPDFKYQRLRQEFCGKYESYADIALNEWIQIRIEVQGEKAKLYINDAKKPSFIINDLKLGENQKGAIGLFVDIGTEGFFKDIKITLQ